MANPVARLKIHIAYLNSTTPYIHAKKFLNILQGIKICAILANFCPNLVVMVTSPTPLKIQVAQLNSRSPWNLLKCIKFPDFFQETEICAILAYFFWIWLLWQLPWFPWKLSSIFEVADPKTWLFMRKIPNNSLNMVTILKSSETANRTRYFTKCKRNAWMYTLFRMQTGSSRTWVHGISK